MNFNPFIRLVVFVAFMAFGNYSLLGQTTPETYTVLPTPIEVTSFPYYEEGFDSDATANGTPTGMMGQCSDLQCCSGVWYKVTITSRGSLYAGFDNFYPLSTSLIWYKADSEDITTTDQLTYQASPNNFCGYHGQAATDYGYQWLKKYYSEEQLAQIEMQGPSASAYAQLNSKGGATFPNDLSAYPTDGWSFEGVSTTPRFIEPGTYWLYAWNTNEQYDINAVDEVGEFNLVIDFVELCPEGFNCVNVREIICSSESFTTENGQVITETSTVEETIGTTITTYNITVDESITCCPDGYTCNEVDVTECASSTYTTPFGNTISETGSVLDEDTEAKTRTVYNVTFDRAEVTANVFSDGIIAASGSVSYMAQTNATGVLTFDKDQDYWVDLNALQDDLNGTSRSVFMWVKSEANVAGDNQVLFAINTGSGGNVAIFWIDNDGDNLELNDGNNARSASFDMSDQLWHYVGYTYDVNSNETVIYVDGIENQRFSNNQSTEANSKYSLGQEFDNANDTDHFNGDMAEISVWNEVLTGAEIRQAMRAKINNGHPKFTNLVGYYSIFGDCDDATDVLKDHSGKGNDGVMVNDFTVDFKNVQSIRGFNSLDWYESISWKKDGIEVSTDPTYTFDVAAGDYELVVTRSFIKSSDVWTLTANSNAITVDNLMDETLCEDDPITRSITDVNAVNYLNFEEDEANYIAVNSLASPLAGQSRSVFMWMNKESNVASGDVDQLLSIMSDDGFNAITNLYINSSEKVTVWDGNNNYVSSTTIANDTWYYVGYTYDAGTFEGKIYINGVEEKTFTKEMPVSAGNLISLGQRYEENGTGGYLDGKLAEITVWDKVLSEEEVNSLMAAAPAYNTANLVAAYGTLQSTADNQLRDLTANGNNGLASHSSIIVSDLEETITDYDASNNYLFSWKKEGTEFDTDATGNITIDEGTTNYSVTYGTPLFQKTDDFSLSYTNLLPTQPISQTTGVTGSVTFEVDEIAGASYQWFKNSLDFTSLNSDGSSFPFASKVTGLYIDNDNWYSVSESGLGISFDKGATWRNVTRDDGLASNSPKVVRANGDNIYAISSQGISISNDGGQNWVNTSFQSEFGIRNPLSISSIAVVNESIYLSSSSNDHGFIKSDDNGLTWTGSSFGDLNRPVSLFADNGKVYAGTETGEFRMSSDQGSTWTTYSPTDYGLPNASSIEDIFVSGTNIYLATNSGLAISNNSGTDWATVLPNENGFFSSLVSAIIADGNKIYVGSNSSNNEGIAISTDNGQSWKVLTSDDQVLNFDTKVYDFQFNGDQLIVATDLGIDISSGRLLLSDNDSDANQVQGATTHQLIINNLLLDENAAEYFVEVTLGDCTQASGDVTLTVLDVPVVSTFTPANQATDVAIDTELTMEFSKTVSKGTGELKLFNYATDVLVETFTADDLTIDGSTVSVTPTSDLAYSTQYYITLDAGLVLDESNAGNLAYADKDTWSYQTVCEPLVLTQPEDRFGVVSGNMTFSVPEVAGASYQWFKKAEGATWNTIAPGQNGFPNTTGVTSVFAVGNNIYVGTVQGISISTDGGSNWTTTIKDQNGFAGSNTVTSVYAEGDNIYVGTNVGLSVSTDGGSSWTTTGRGENGFSVANALAGNIVKVNSVYAEGNNIYAGTIDGLSISTDGGSSWITTTSGQNGFAGSSNVPSVYAVGQNIYAATFDGGLSISTDGGSSWTTTTSGQNGFAASNSVRSVYAEGSKVYVGTVDGGGLSISTDGGTTWTTVVANQNGFPNRDNVMSVSADGDMIVAGSIASTLSISQDGGTNWTTTTGGQDGFPNSFLFSSVYTTGGNIYAVTDAGLSIFRNDTSLTDIADNTADNQIQGASTNTLTISNLTEDFDQTEYFVIVTKGDCEETSDIVTLSIVDAPLVARITPVNGAYNIDSDVNITIKFNRAVALGSGGINLIDYSTDELIARVDLDEATIVNDNTVVLPITSLNPSTKYYLKIDAGAVIDQSNIANIAIDTKETYGFTTEINYFSSSADDERVFLGSDANLNLVTDAAGNIEWYKVKGEDEVLSVESVDLNEANIIGTDFEDGKFYYFDSNIENRNKLFIYDIESGMIESRAINYNGRLFLNEVKVRGQIVIVYRTDSSNGSINYLYISTDGGRTFRERQYTDISQFKASDFVITDAGTFYTFVRMNRDFSTPNALGLFKSTDFGETYEFINITDLADGLSFSSFTSMAISENEEQIFIFNGAAIYSLDGGQSFAKNSTKFQSGEFIDNELYVTITPRNAYHVPDPTNLSKRNKIISSTSIVYSPLMVGDQLFFPYNHSNFGLIREDLTTEIEFINKLSVESTFGSTPPSSEGKFAYKNYLYLVNNSSNSLVKVKFADILEGETSTNLSLSNIDESASYFAIMNYLGTYGYSSFSDVLVTPKLVSVTPIDDATNVSISPALSAEFDISVQEGSGSILIKRVDNDQLADLIGVTSDVSFDDNIISFQLDLEALENNTEYYVEIAEGVIESLEGVAFPGITDKTTWSFTTEGSGDQLAIASLSPSNDAVDLVADDLNTTVPNFNKFWITFTDGVKYGNLSAEYKLYTTSDDQLVASQTLSSTLAGPPIGNTSAGFGFYNYTFEQGTSYYILMDAGMYKSVATDEEFPGITDKATWSFTTALGIDPINASSFAPEDNSTNVPLNIENHKVDFLSGHVLIFDDAVKPGSSGLIQLFKAQDNSLAFEINTANDPIVIQEEVETQVGSAYILGFGQRALVINADVTLEPNTEYYWFLDEGLLADNETDAPFAGISDATTWSFTTADIQPLVLTGLNPDNNDTDVDIDQYLQFEFDQNIEVGTGNVTIYDQNDQVFEVIDVTATSRVQSETRLRVYPSKFYTPSEAYYVLADAGVARGTNGAAFAGISDKTAWAFTIEDYEEVDADEFFPEPGSRTYDVSKGKKFEVDFERYVELSDDSEVSNGNLRVYEASDDALIVTIELSEMTFGEEEATFDVAGLESGTEYYVLFDDGLFVDLEEPRSFEGISDPTAWRFTTLAVPTTPSLFSINPGPNATDVSISTNIVLNYSENVQANPDAVNNVVIYDANDNVVETFPANTLNYSGVKVTINPTHDLAYNTSYYVLVDDEAFISNNEVKTAAITDPTVISFTTASQPNTAPVASSVSLAGSLEANLQLTGSYNYSDADTDAESGSTLQWFVADDASGANRTAISGATSDTYSLTSSEVGKYITFAVTPNDGTDAGTQTFASYAGPVVAAVVPTVISTIPTDGSVDVAKDVSLSFTFSESVTAGTGNITLTPVSGAAAVIDVTSNEVTVSGTDVTINPASNLLDGEFYTVTFDAASFVDADGNNSAGLASQTSWNFTVKEANVAPVAQGVSIKKSLVVDGVLEGSYTYSDANDDAESGTTFQWYRADDATGTGRAAITGATSENYTVVNDDNGKFVSFEVTPNDGALAGAAVESAFFGAILINDGFTNIPPAFTSDALTSVLDNAAYSYTITYEDLNNDVPTLTKTNGPNWLTVNGLILSGNPTSANIGDHDLVLTLDDQNGGAITQEFTVTVLASNTAPQIKGVDVKGMTTIDEVLTANYNFVDSEDDADNSSYKWYRSDDNSGTGKVAINGATTTSYTLVAADAGKFISFEVTPNDGTVDGAAQESSLLGAVAKKIPTLSLSDIAKTYGDADFNLAATTNSSGTVTYAFNNDQTGANVNGATVTLGNVGEITVDVSLTEDTEYQSRQVQSTITIGKKAIELTATDASKNVGDVDPTLNYAVTTGSIVGSDEVVTVGRDAGEEPGTYAINLTDGADAANYEITAVPGVFTISQRSLTITAQAATKTYGDTDPDFAYSITSGSLNTGDELSGAVTRVNGENVGTYTLENGLFNPNYDISFESADLTIEKADLTATADDQTKYLGEANPELTIGYSGFANGDTRTDITEPTIATTATESSPIGTYDITLSGGAAANYNLNLVNGQLTVAQRPFIITLDAKNAKGREVEVLGIIEGLTYDYTVDWGDGNIDTNLTEAAKHTYTSAGPFTVRVTGNYPGLQLKYFNIKSIEQWGSQEWESLENALQNRDLTINATDTPDLSQGPSMAGMFRSTRIGSPDLTAWDVSMITNMSDIFNGSDFNGNVSNWNVSNVTDMSGAFGGTPFNGDISTWNVGSVTTMRSMFIQATDFNGDLSNWDVSSVTNMESVFNNADAFNGNISSWDVSSVTDMTGMFSEADLFNQNISMWDVSNVKDMAAMFSGTKAFNQPLDAWDVSSVVTMEIMFRNADAFNQDLNSWDVSKVEKFDEMFKQTALFNGDITGWDVSSGQDFEEMFQETEAFNQPIGNWNLASATRVRRMFRDAEVFNQPINDWRFPNLESLEQMFWGALVFNQDLNDWDVSNITNMASTFEEAESFNGNISNWDVSKVEDFDEFMNETPFNQDISGWNVSSAKDFGRMFEDSPNFNQDLSNWDMSKATDVAYMFESAASFDQDISGWQLSSVTSFGSMLKNSGLSVENYDAFLISISEQELKTDVQFDVEGLQYCAGTVARQSLIDNYNWTIGNDTQGCSSTVTIADVSAKEDDGAIKVTLISDAFVVGGFTVDVSTSNGTAEAGADYTAVTAETITFAGTVGETQSFNIVPTKDADVEGDETLTVSMSNLVTDAVNTVTITDDEATITILNDDVPVVSFNTTAQSNAESVTSSSIVVNLNQAGLSAATVDYSVTGTATGGGVDHTLANGTVNFAAGELNKTIDLTIVDDALIEENETVVITLSNVSGASLGTNTVFTYTIVNNDAQVTIEDVSQFEDGESFLVTATLQGTIEGGFTVDLSTTDGTAMVADGDYTAVSGTTLTFIGTDGEVQKLDIAPGVDSKLEADETFTVSLSNLSGTTANVVITDQAVLTIKNDDAAAVTLADASGNEGDGAITVTATLDNAVQGGFTVEVNTADGTATLTDSDYTAVAGKTLTFTGTAGETQTFTVTPTNDLVIEANETLTVSMSNMSSSLAVNVSDEATVTIVNDDFNNAPTDITISASSIAENNALDAAIGTLTTTDADAGNTHTYALVSGAGDTENASFTLEGSTLKANNTSFNFEDKASYSVRIETNDGEGGTFAKAFEITVTNVNEAPFTLSLTNATIDEADEAQEVGQLMSLDPDNGDSFTYSLVAGDGDADNAQFAISGNTLSTAGAIDFEDGASRSIRVQVADAGGLTFDQTFSITIEDVVAEPVREYTQNQPGADVKNVFSPNGDGVNETWVIEDLLDNPFNQVKIFAQGGKLIYSKVNYSNDWAGTFKDNPVPDGTYYYEILIFENEQSTSPARTIKGFLTIIRNR